ncbi:MAG: Lpg1974 family pore-forming outer membrane protein [Pirellulaceae bacterium]
MLSQELRAQGWGYGPSGVTRTGATLLAPDEPPPVNGAPVVSSKDAGCAVGCECSCDSPGSCHGSCGCACEKCCALIVGFQHCWHVYGEFLFLRPRDSELAWVTPANSNFPVPPNPAPVQIGPQGVLDMDFDVGFRGGIQHNMTECTGVSVQYTMFESTTNDAVAVAGANVIESLVSHPAIDTTARNFRQGVANYNINYDMIDLDYHELLWYGADYQFGYLLGANFVQMEEVMGATFAGNGTETVRTDIDFYGAGLRFGLEGEAGRGGQVRAYAKAIGNLVGGEFRADYDLGHSYDAVVIDTGWRAGRVVGIWNLELGAKWISCCGNYSANVGYMFSAWTNTVQTDEWVRGVQTSNFIDMDSTMTFDGAVARLEARF